MGRFDLKNKKSLLLLLSVSVEFTDDKSISRISGF